MNDSDDPDDPSGVHRLPKDQFRRRAGRAMTIRHNILSAVALSGIIFASHSVFM